MVSFDPGSTKVPMGDLSGTFNRMNSGYSKANSASSDKSKFRSRDDPLTAVKFDMSDKKYMKSPTQNYKHRSRSGVKNYMAQNR
jgi:hypothetical protein